MKLAVITDEFTQSLPEAISFAHTHHIEGLELRTLDDLPLEALSRSRLSEVASTLKGEHLPVCSLASSFCKCAYEDRFRERDKLFKLMDAAHILGSPFIRGFAYLAEGAPSPSQMADSLQESLAMLEREGLTLLLEADPSVSTTNHASLSAFIRLLDHPSARAIYDPGNDLFDPLGETPYPDGYEAIFPYLAHVHLKDAVKTAEGPMCVCLGEGEANFSSLLKRLSSDGYKGYASLEMHYRKETILSESQMQRPGGEAFSRGGCEAAAECAAAFYRLTS